ESERRHVVVRTAAVEALPCAACHAMRPRSPDRLSQRGIASNDCASLGCRHVLVAVKTERRRFAESSGCREPWRMGCVLDQQQAFPMSEGLPGITLRKIAAEMHENDGLCSRAALVFGVAQRHQGNLRRLDINEDRPRS